jgi:hypothetical protein
MRILDRWRADLRLGRRPSYVRAWRPEQAILPQISFQDEVVHVRNVRDFTFHSPTEFTPAYRDQTYDLNQADRVWFVVAPFTWEWRGPAHTFLSFGFANGEYLGISVEARRAAGEAFSLVKGALRQFDLMYVLGTERDLIGLRAVTWNDPVYLYPIRATPEQIRAVLLGMLRRAQALAEQPEFYNTFTNNCTTNILQAVNAIAPRPIPYGLKILLPGYTDALAYKRGLIDTDLSLAAARARFRVNARAQAAIEKPDFSERIRALPDIARD